LIISVIVTVVFVIYLIAKIRTQAAILRIDKNVQKLVDLQIATSEKKPTHADASENSDENFTEQN